MIHIVIPEGRADEKRRLPFYLAVEEWVARRLPAGDYFFSWQVEPTVICGRNQDIEKEVNLDYCKEHGIDVVRRKSGGGCVFSDSENFMFSFITASDKVTEVFSNYTAMIARCLQKIGIAAEASGRNDIMIGDRKVSGNAFYHIPGRSIAHGTMLYSFNPEILCNALTPSRAKLESKGVKSVPKRVTCLKEEGISLTPAEFQKFMVDTLTEGEPYILSENDVNEVKEIERGYYDPSFLRIDKEKDDKDSSSIHVVRNKFVKGLGEFCVEYNYSPGDNVMKEFSISGDFFMRGDVERLVCHPFEGLSLEKPQVKETVIKVIESGVIPGLEEQTLLELILGEECDLQQ